MADAIRQVQGTPAKGGGQKKAPRGRATAGDSEDADLDDIDDGDNMV